MTYAIVVPPKYLGDLVGIREATGVSIRQQILNAIENWINLSNDLEALFIQTLEKVEVVK
jgi:hypothetical protein